MLLAENGAYFLGPTTSAHNTVFPGCSRRLKRIWIFALLYLRIYPLLDFASYSCYAFPVDPPSSLDFVKVLCSSLRMYPTT
ncbi:hypothetical protein BDA96_04G118500 [Sorghum bicolor]|uniref:Uncharacterized protein n=1 Tax=Sorghum bicolor TaxID=4558 RepID=A0A921UI75_SORBI|nr:hypothetical protein BDA96_04G118500 [Sorghum bicolor]KAG0532570.1 hypothetical protein BDA96_04G118500 [Sorghum bicolor]